MSDFSRNDPFREPASPRARRRMRRRAVAVAGLCLAVVPAAYVAFGGVGAMHTAEGALWIEADADRSDRSAVVVRSSGSMADQAWIELLRSYQVLDSVAVSQRLFLRTSDHDRGAFDSFGLASQFRPGAYVLEVDDEGTGFILTTSEGAFVEQGIFGSSIGRGVGFEWAPPADAFEPGAPVAFEVLTPRAASTDVSERLFAMADRSGSFLMVRLSDSDPERAVTTLNAIMDRYVYVAAQLKRRKHEETVRVLEEQLATMENQLAEAERELAGLKSRPGQDVAGPSMSPTEWKAEEGRLRRLVRSTEYLHSDVRRRVEAGRLAQASARPDVRILDEATLMDEPAGWRGPLAAFRVFLLGLAATIALSALLGRADIRTGTDFRVS